MMLLQKYTEIMVHITGATSYRKDHLLVSTFSDIPLIVKHLVKDEVFEQHLRRDVETETLLCNVFGEGITNI